jgi:hypothetical protein
MAAEVHLRNKRIQFALGMVQIAGVGFSMGIISRQGFSMLAMLFVIATTALAIISSVLRRNGNGDSDGQF